MRLPFERIGRRSGHYDLDRSLVIVVRMPFRPQCDDLVVEINADVAAHADGHGFTRKTFNTLFEMLHQVGSNLTQPLLGAN